MSDAADNLLSGRAWHDFCDRLRGVGDTIIGEGFPQQPRDRTEGFRYLTRLLSYAMRMEIECGDPLYPQLCRYEEPHNNWGGPNPDNTYLRAQIHPDYGYRVWGNLTDMRQIIISLQEGDMQLEQYGVYSEQGLDDWTVGPDGEWELFVTTERPDLEPAVYSETSRWPRAAPYSDPAVANIPARRSRRNRLNELPRTLAGS